MDNIAKPHVTAHQFAQARPDRFALAMGGLNPAHAGFPACVGSPPSPTCRWCNAAVGPSFWGDARYPPSDAVYYPLYTKRVELNPAVVHQYRLAGPRFPARRNPIHLDRGVCGSPSCGCA